MKGQATRTPISIIYEDGEALVIDKPAGLPIDRPRRGGPSLEDHLEELKLGFQRAPVPVHRLDQDTSGCLLLARNPKALKRFNKAFEDRLVSKSYTGLVAGEITEKQGAIELSLSKVSSAEKGWRMIAAKKGKPAITHWSMLGFHQGVSIVQFRPVTGRTHQIRIHALAGLGFPLVGDPIYGKPDPRCSRTMLHATSLVVPRENKPPITAVSELPQDFEAFNINRKDKWIVLD